MSDKVPGGFHLWGDAADVFELHFVDHVDGVGDVGLDDGEEGAVRARAVGAAELCGEPGSVGLGAKRGWGERRECVEAKGLRVVSLVNRTSPDEDKSKCGGTYDDHVRNTCIG